MELQYEPWEDGVRLLSYPADGLVLFLPEELDGKPVRVIGERAFVNQKFGEVRFPKSLKRIESRAFSGCMGVEILHFPEELSYIGSHAFTNCIKLKEISFCGNLFQVDDSAFLHCSSLSKVYFDDSKGNYLGFQQVIGQLEHEVEAEISGKRNLHLLFTDFAYHDMENSPAHLFQFYVDGCGQFYRRCITPSGIDLRQYDELLSIAAQKDDPEAVMKIANFRMTDGHGLRPLAKAAYLRYMRERREEMCRFAIRQDDRDLLERLEKWEVFGEDLVANLTDYAHSQKKYMCLSWLMNKKSSWDDDKDFDL